MKRLSVLAVLPILLLVVPSTLEAQQARKKQAPKPAPVRGLTKPDVPTSSTAFQWLHYGVNPLVPDSYIPVPDGVEVTDTSQTKNIILGAAGYEKANQAVRLGLASVFSGEAVTTPLPVSSPQWQHIRKQFADGNVEEKCIADGERAGDDALVFGYKTDARGVLNLYVEKPYAVNKTGGLICGLITRDPVQLESGRWVRPIIYRQCRNVSAFHADAPVPVRTEAPPPPPPVVISPTSIADAIERAPNVITRTEKVVVHGPCRFWGAPCWVWPTILGAAAGGTACYFIHEHRKASADLPPEKGKDAVPLPPRPIGSITGGSITPTSHGIRVVFAVPIHR